MAQNRMNMYSVSVELNAMILRCTLYVSCVLLLLVQNINCVSLSFFCSPCSVSSWSICVCMSMLFLRCTAICYVEFCGCCLLVHWWSHIVNNISGQRESIALTWLYVVLSYRRHTFKPRIPMFMCCIQFIFSSSPPILLLNKWANESAPKRNSI